MLDFLPAATLAMTDDHENYFNELLLHKKQQQELVLQQRPELVDDASVLSQQAQELSSFRAQLLQEKEQDAGRVQQAILRQRQERQAIILELVPPEYITPLNAAASRPASSGSTNQ
jgi:hypothetical protein